MNHISFRTDGSTNTHLLLSALYSLAALAGLIGTWWFNFAFFGSDPDMGYISAWFANDASSSAAVDLLVMAGVASVYMIIDGQRNGIRGAWLHVVFGFVVAIAFTFPLYLARREYRLARKGDRS